MPTPQDTPQDTGTRVDVGSQRARQGQNIRGMRKVLIAGILLTVIGFAVLLLGYAAWETDDPSPQADLRTESNAQTPPVFDQPSSPPEDADGSAPGTVPPPPGGPVEPAEDAREGTPGR